MTNRDDLSIKIAHLEEQQKTIEFEIKDAEWTIKEAKLLIAEKKKTRAQGLKRLTAVKTEIRALEAKA